MKDTGRAYDLQSYDNEAWVEEGKKVMLTTLSTKPLEIKEHFEWKLRELQEAYGGAIQEMSARKKIEIIAG